MTLTPLPLRAYPAAVWMLAIPLLVVLIGAVLYAPAAGFVIGVVCLGALALPFIARVPQRLLLFFILGFAFISGREEGLGWHEVVYGLVFYGYLTLYVGTRLLRQPGTLLESGVDVAMLFFIGWTALSTTWALWLGADPGALVSEVACVLSMLIYFPARDAARREGGAKLIVLALLVLVVYVAVRNMINYRQVLLYATIGWEFKSRVTTNEILLVTGCVGFLVLAASSARLRVQTFMLLLFSISFISLIVTQTRAFWVDFAFAGCWLLLLLRGPSRYRLVLLTSISAIFIAALAYLVLGNTLFTLALGFLERAATIGSSTEKDISLISRFYEANAVMELVRANPLLGYGPGLYYSFFDIIEKATDSRYWVHNGFVGLLYKAGLIGTIPILWAWGMLIWRGLRLCFTPLASPYVVILAVMLLAMIPSATTAMQFYASDIAFVFALTAGGVAGTWQRRITPEAG